MIMYWIIFIGFALASWLISMNLKSKFKKYSKIPLVDGLTGQMVAEKMLRDNGILDVKVTATSGMLTDHYNPVTKTVNLSESVFHSNNVAAAAVAAHECGHAIQHAQAYAPLQFRSKMVPAVSFASQWMQWVIFGGFLLLSMPIGKYVLLAGIVLYAVTTIFSFVTLPVEIDASRRALAWLNMAGITTSETHENAKSALKSAAYTYVVAALGSLAVLVYYILSFLGMRD
ncbi:MAG: zinc metallopeptidase [Paludibacteraceae bacterium]|nr:zinc metallopeptidase [Paludibacteraceae bacterium]